MWNRKTDTNEADLSTGRLTVNRAQSQSRTVGRQIRSRKDAVVSDAVNP